MAVGDFVSLKLQPYRQSSVALRRNLKLACKFYGPFKVLEKVGTVAYRLELPPLAKIHPVFHVSQLKKHIGSHIASSNILPEEDATGSVLVAPVVVLDTRVHYTSQGDLVIEWLVQWKNLDVSEATWEPDGHMMQQFPLCFVQS